MIQESTEPKPQITIIQKTWRGFLARRRARVHAEQLVIEGEGDGKVGSYSRQSSQQSRKLKVPPRTPPRGNSTKFEPKDVLPQSTKVVEKIPFNKTTDLDISIDGAIGLPLTATLVRIRVELHMPTKEILDIKSPYVYSDFLSEHTSPQFALRMQWKARMLHPTMTIVCRIETLESPSLEPRCIGISALRLCVDLLGMQPLSEVLSDGKPSCFFNAGQFMVPILYGTFPTDIQFATESKIQLACPHVDGAYLRMSINPLLPGEKSGDKPPQSSSPYAGSRKVMAPSSSSRASNYQASTMEFHRELNDAANATVDPWSLPSRSVGAVLLKTYLASEKDLSPPPLPIPEALLDKFREGTNFDIGEKLEVRNAIVNWSQERFDENKVPTEAINQRYLLEYSDTAGANATLDMLYNMPDRKKLTQAAERAAHVAAMRSGLIRGWDSQLNYYKTIFRYLPGSIPTSPSSKEENDKQDKSRDMRLVVDDASVRPVFESPEQCPAFCDDFSSTEGLRLGPHACLLVVVTAVDVLISRKVAAQKDKYSSSDLTGEKDPSYLSPMNSKASIFSEDASTKIAEKKLKMTKLKGLKGIYVGAKDPKSTFWGIVPLFAKFPNPLLNNATFDEAYNSYVNNNNNNNNNSNNSNSNNNNVTAQNSSASAGAPLPSSKKQDSQAAIQKLDLDPSDTQGTDIHTGGVSNHSSTEENSPQGMKPIGSTTNNSNHSVYTAAMLSSLAAMPVFVNSGTHQIPLFRGLPPEEMITAPDPMAWLVNRIYHQLSRGPIQATGTSPLAFLLYPCLACAGGAGHESDVVVPNAPAFAQQHRIPVNATTGSSFDRGDPNNNANLKEKETSWNKNNNNNNNGGGNNKDRNNVQRGQSALLTRNTSSRFDLTNSKSRKKKGKKSKNVDLVLSDGASAIIRIVDPRVKRLAQHHAAITPSTTNSHITGSLGTSAKITSMAGAANVVRASLRVSQKYAAGGSGTGVGSGNNATGMASPGNGDHGVGSGNGMDGNGMGHYHHPSSEGTTHSMSPALIPLRSDILEEVLLLHAHTVHEKNAPLVLDINRLRTLRQNFSVQPNRFIKKKTVKSALPESMDAYYLIQEINTKFYEVISS